MRATRTSELTQSIDDHESRVYDRLDLLEDPGHGFTPRADMCVAFPDNN